MAWSQTQQDNFNILLTEIISTVDKDIITPQWLEDQLESNNLERDLLAEYLLNYMADETSTLGSYPIVETTWGDIDTLFHSINEQIDLDGETASSITKYFDGIRSNILDKFGSSEDGYRGDDSWIESDGQINKTKITAKIKNDKERFWNESIVYLLAYFLRYIDQDFIKEFENLNPIDYSDEIAAADQPENRTLSDTTYLDDFPSDVDNTYGSIPVTDGSLKGGYRVTDIKNANAANSFSAGWNSDKTIFTPWVVPNYNINGKTYDGVRQKDEILQALQSGKQMQFTRKEGTYHYIRLIMDKYLRRVEVEDLDRNFWVIGQVLAAISAYLFDDNSPLKEVLSGFLNEIIQIWENLLYLWIFLLVKNMREITNVVTEVCYVPRSDIETYRKFDDFKFNEDYSDFDYVSYFSYLKDEYSESNLCIVPAFRCGGIKHNYYTDEVYPATIFYNRNTDEWTVIKNSTVIDIGEDKFASKIGGLNWSNGTSYAYMAPFDEIKNMTSSMEDLNFYGLLRVKPKITASYSDGVISAKVFLYVQDVARLMYDSSYIDSDYTGYYYINTNSAVTSTTPEYYDSVNKIENTTEKIFSITKGFYRGELASFLTQAKEVSFDLKIYTYPCYPLINVDIGDSTQTYTITNSVQYISISGNKIIDNDTDQEVGNTATQDIKMLEKLEENSIIDYKGEASPFVFATSQRLYGFWYSNLDTDGIYGYYNKEGTGKKFTTSTYNRNAGSAAVAALLYNAYSDSYISYPKYYRIDDHCYALGYYNNATGSTQGWGNRSTFIYTTDSKGTIKENNWCIRYIQAAGPYTTYDHDDFQKGISKEILTDDTTEGTLQSDNGEFTSDIYGMCTSIQINLFFPDGTYAFKIYRRAKSPDNSNMANAMSAEDYWLDGSFSGSHPWESTEYSSNYKQLRAKIDNNYYVKSAATYDYEKYHNNGTSR